MTTTSYSKLMSIYPFGKFKTQNNFFGYFAKFNGKETPIFGKQINQAKKENIKMKNQIMITAKQIIENKPYQGFAKKLIENIITDINNPFPVSSILDIKQYNYDNYDHISNTIICLMSLPTFKENKALLVKFALFCAKRVAYHAGDKLIKECVSVIEDYIKGNADKEQLDSVITISNIIYGENCDLPLGFAAQSVEGLAMLAHEDADTPKKVHCYVSNAYYCALQTVINDDVEVEEQTAYLRKLLDGEEE